MKITLPSGWEDISENGNSATCSFHKTYPDGLDVVLTIDHKNGVFELWSSAEHRCSGPSKNKDSEHTDMDAALQAALDEMNDWDSE